jgi:hypothetical protein
VLASILASEEDDEVVAGLVAAPALYNRPVLPENWQLLIFLSFGGWRVRRVYDPSHLPESSVDAATTLRAVRGSLHPVPITGLAAAGSTCTEASARYLSTIAQAADDSTCRSYPLVLDFASLVKMAGGSQAAARLDGRFRPLAAAHASSVADIRK